jgi:putative flippase GtrA
VSRVSIVRALYSRFEHLVHELGKFGTVGAIALVVNMTVFNVMLGLFANKQIFATAISTVIATVVAYVGNRYWTYKDRDKIDRSREMFFFFLINGVAAVIEIAAVFVSKYGLNQDGRLAVNIAKYGFGLPLGMLFRLYTYRTFVFPQGADLGPDDEYVPPSAHAPLHLPGHTHAPQPYPHPVAETASR